MTKLKGDETFLCINQCVNIFDIVSCKEQQASELIAWLFDPLESHGLGKDFFAAFLDVLSSDTSECSSIYGWQYENRRIKAVRKEKEALKNAYDDVVIQKEYWIETGEKENRVDILLCLEKAHTLFVIENKYGAKEHNGQTRKYYKYFSKAAYKDYAIFYVYLDVYDFYGKGGRSLADSSHWKKIDYDWIIDFLSVYKKKVKNKAVSKILHDIYIEFSGNYEDEKYFSPYFELSAKELSVYKGTGLDRYEIISKNNRIKTKKRHFYNYRGFYDSINGGSFWEKYLSISDNIYLCGRKKFVCDIKRTRMFLTPIKIYDNFRNFVDNHTQIRGLDWPIYCTLSYDGNKVNYCLEAHKKDLQYFDNLGELIKQLKDKKILGSSEEISGSSDLPQLSKNLDDFLNKCSDMFNIVQKAKYNEAF